MRLIAVRLTNIDLLGFFLVFALLFLSGLLGYWNVRQLAASTQMVDRSYENIVSLETLLSTIKDAETGQRGFLLTEDEAYLEPFHTAREKVERDLSRIKKLVLDKAIQQDTVDQIEKTVAEKLDELNQTIGAAKSGDRTSVLAIIRSGTGKEAMDTLRKNISQLQSMEYALLDERAIRAKRNLDATIWAIIVSTVVGIVLTGFVMTLTQKNIRQREISLAIVTEQKERLRVTLASIGDGVITTDDKGLVTNLNPVAEELTGWKSKEAVGVPLTTVFTIVNETTRETVLNPAMKALREGTIVGLANHTILIAKSGRERFIDDSAAPVRDTDGNIFGCILVFRDITERRHLEKELASRLAQARLLAAIVETSGDAIISKTLDGTIQTWNKGAELLFGFKAEHSVGKHISILIPPERLEEEDHFLNRLRAGEPVRHFETVRRTSDGQLVDVSINLSPILDDAGQVVAASKIARDITDRKKTEEKLRQLAAELSDSNRRKDEFLATLAHELRNPLAPIRNGLRVIQLADGNKETIEETRSLMDRQVTQLVRLVDDLLDVSRISRGKLEMRREPIDLMDAIKIAIETCRPIIDENGHILEVQGSADPAFVDADMIRLAQVFANLLNNAAKYSERGGQISLKIERLENEVEIRITDTGVGIPGDMLGKVFEMFTQVDRSLEKSQGGLGIGLTLVKRLVEMHQGTISAHSDGYGKGSRFIVRLPVVTSLLAKKIESESAIKNDDVKQRLKILIADDNKDAAKTLAKILSFMGHEVQAGYDGMEAVQLANSFRPDVILLDIGMPKLNGYEACRQIRQYPWGETTVIIALTGWGQDEDRRLSQQAGFTHHLVKPVDTTQLKQLLGLVH